MRLFKPDFQQKVRSGTMYQASMKSRKDSNAEHIHYMYEQAVRSLPFNTHTAGTSIKPSPGNYLSARFSYNISQGKRKEVKGLQKSQDGIKLVGKCKESLNSLMDGTPEAMTADTRQCNRQKAIKERFYMYSQEYSPLVQFMNRENSQRKSKQTRSPGKGTHVKQQSEDWAANLLDHMSTQ